MSDLAMPSGASANGGSVKGSSPFNPRVILMLLLFGAAAFLATLYFIGSGQTGESGNGAGGHAESNGMLGYAALARVLESTDHEVTLSRSPSNYQTEGLLILTPPHFTDEEALQDLIENRRYIGPTMIIMPKWGGTKIPDDREIDKEDGWVNPGMAYSPYWAEELAKRVFPFEHHVDRLDADGPDWEGLGMSGMLPDRTKTTHIHSDDVAALVEDNKGQLLAGYVIDGGYYPTLDRLSGMTSPDEDAADGSMWNVMLVIEPDLMNNYGLSDRERAKLAHALVDAAMEDEDLDITFDLTLNGQGRQENLLTLAFRPPFLAATICLLIAMIVVGWRAFLRFGPPVAEGRAIAFGKTQLVSNSASFIQRTKRLHLLANPYADMVATRLAHQLGLKTPDPEAIDAALDRRLGDGTSFSARAADLRNARKPKDMLRAAKALRDIERMLTE